MNQVGWKKCEKINENWMNKFQSKIGNYKYHDSSC